MKRAGINTDCSLIVNGRSGFLKEGTDRRIKGGYNHSALTVITLYRLDKSNLF
jgi:hypothetical protein